MYQQFAQQMRPADLRVGGPGGAEAELPSD